MSTGGAWDRWIHERLGSIDAAGQRRRIRTLRSDGATARIGGPTGDGTDDGTDERELICFASNDYLGLATHPDLAAAAARAAHEVGTGSGASRLVTGSRPVHDELEAILAEWKATETALLFPTGYAANLGVLAALGRGATILSDALNHASIIDGTRLTRDAEVHVYRHGDLAHLESLLAARPAPTRLLVVTDAVFSMDGDVADLAGIAELCARHEALLVVDEAHAVLGPDTAAVTAALDPTQVVRVGTLSKALGSHGGFVAASRAVVDLCANTARTFIFTTASSPPDAAAALEAVRIVRGPEGAARLGRLADHVARFAPGHPSPIVPVVVGDERDALAAAAALEDEGFWVPAIRPPTVAPGTARLRVTFSATHTTEQVDALAVALERLGLRDHVQPDQIQGVPDHG